MKEKEIGYRNGTCEIREGGYILSFYSGSAWDFGYDVFRLDNDSKELRWIESLYAVKEAENGNNCSRYYWSSSEFTDKKQISEERYQQLIGRYRTPELHFVENNDPQTGCQDYIVEDSCLAVTIDGITYYVTKNGPYDSLPNADCKVIYEELQIEGLMVDKKITAYALIDNEVFVMVDDEWYEFTAT